jgi:hypothetical protein
MYFAKSSLVEDDLTPIRYCADDIKHIEITVSSISFSILHQIREIKTWRGRWNISNMHVVKLPRQRDIEGEV